MASAEADRFEPVVVDRAGDAWFASDLHLDDDQPDLTARFRGALQALDSARATSAAAAPGNRGHHDSGRPALFLLGDLFEFWIGDDHPSRVATELASALATLAAHGWRVFLMRGNRDFLIGEAYARRCEATLLDEPALLQIEGERIVLTHGDAECLDDNRYQQWRSLSHSTGWQQQFLARSIEERLAMARAARAASLANRQADDDRQADDARRSRVEGGGDLSSAAVAALLERFDAGGLIHGHTHRPALHPLDDRRWRWVLPDWEVQPPRGAILSFAALRTLSHLETPA